MHGLMDTNSETAGLVKKAQQGERRAFDRLIELCRDRLEYGVRLRLGKHLQREADVEDVLQETGLRAFRSIGNFKWQGEDSFLRWLVGIASHVLLEVASRERRHTGTLPRPDSPEDPSQSRILRREERFERLQEAFNLLSPEHQRVILLARMHDLPLSVVAERMGRSPAAVKQLLFRALQKLKTRFGDTESLRLPDRRLRDAEDGDSDRGGQR